MQFLRALNFLNTYRPAALIAFIISIGAFSGIVFHILFRWINGTEIPTSIDTIILESLVVLFVLGTFYCFCCWLDIDLKDQQQEPVTLIQNIFNATLILAICFIPEYLYIINKGLAPERSYIQLYLFVQVYVLIIYWAYTTFQFRKLLPLHFIGLKRISWISLLGLITLAAFANFFKDYLYQVIRSFHIALVLVISLFFALQLKWIIAIRAQQRIKIILQLFVINAFQFFLLYHYYTEEDKGFFNILSLPTEYYLCLLIFPVCFAIVALLGNILYWPIAKVVDHKDNEIRSLTQMNKFIQNKENLDDVFNFLLNYSVNDTEAKAGWILLQNSYQKEVLKCKNINIEKATQIHGSIKENFPLGLHEQAYLNIINAASFQPQIKNIAPFTSLMVFEIHLSKGEKGMLYIAHEDAEAFEEYHVQMICSYIDQAKIAYENQRLFSESVQTESVKRELELATKIHNSLLPEKFPQNHVYEIAGYMESSKEMGGDFFDFFELKNDSLGILIGDVSGKGMPAALYMAEIKGIFHSLSQFDISIDEMIVKANESIAKFFEKNHFVTLTYLIINKKQQIIRYVRCGHCPILYYHFNNLQTDFFDDKGIGLGIIRNNTFKEHIQVYEKPFNTHDIMVLYTDGLTEAIDKKTGKQYGPEELKYSLSQSNKKSAETIKNSILQDFSNMITQQENPDDLALIIVKFK